jgi:RNA polymerase sigma factor (TIGR02999 family)
MRREKPGQTLQTTALVNEAYLRLLGAGNIDWHDRAHFFAVSAQIMRRILVEAARARATGRRGGGALRVDLDEIPDFSGKRDQELILLDDALEVMKAMDPRKVQVIEMKFFGGLSVEEIAAVLKISPRSVMRDWNLAKTWLKREIRRSSET